MESDTAEAGALVERVARAKGAQTSQEGGVPSSALGYALGIQNLTSV